MTRRNIKLAAALLFCLGAFMPMLSYLIPALDISPEVNEKRALSKFPDTSRLALAYLPRVLTNYFYDRFGYRNLLIQTNSRIRYKALSVSSTRNVVVGQEGWLFYRGDESERNFLGILPKSHEERFEDFRNELEAKRVALAKLGTAYVFVIAPGKWTVYPEFLRKGYNRSSRSSNTDHLLAYLKGRTTVPIVDLRAALTVAKRSGRQLYFKFDTHWNDLGAFYGYRTLMSTIGRLFPGLEPRRLEDFVVKPVVGGGTDLAVMLAIAPFVEPAGYELTPRRPYGYERVASAELAYKHENQRLPRALVFRDSFGGALAQYLTDHFSSVSYVPRGEWRSCEDNGIPELLARTRPQIVIEERVERYLIRID